MLYKTRRAELEQPFIYVRYFVFFIYLQADVYVVSYETITVVCLTFDIDTLEDTLNGLVDRASTFWKHQSFFDTSCEGLLLRNNSDFV